MPGFSQLSYVDEQHKWFQRFLIRAVERTVDQEHYEALYEYWRATVVPQSRNIFGSMLKLVDINLITDKAWPPTGLGHRPIIIVANHPFGIGDGVAALALAEGLGRPFKVLINDTLMKVPDIVPYALPVSFDETRKGLTQNIQMRRDALKFLKDGGTIVVFPAGGVATAPKGWGKAEDLPWKLFTAALIEKSEATVVPVYFSGQNGLLFHLVSKFSMTLRLSLLVREFARLSGKSIKAYIGDPISADIFKSLGDRKAIIDFLRQSVFALSERDLK